MKLGKIRCFSNIALTNLCSSARVVVSTTVKVVIALSGKTPSIVLEVKVDSRQSLATKRTIQIPNPK